MNNFHLKLIAVLTMLIDHAGAILFPEVAWLRYIGRLSFPVYCFLIAQGAVHTHNLKKYFFRLLTFAVLSEIPFNLAFHNEVLHKGNVNVFFTLAIGLLAAGAVKKFKKKWYFSVAAVVGAMLLAQVLHCDYRWYGVLLIAAFYLVYNEQLLAPIVLAGATEMYCFTRAWSIASVSRSNGLFEMMMKNSQQYAVLAAVPILLYNGEKGYSAGWVKWAFYLFYPVHLLILWLIHAVV